ncbi:MAG TPA: hypothetical protein VG456_22355 [Candidatus Sulfopaludibacter sp.]|jgi:hypothetical protein|nr:hypothetical protein [Candidatus Sulfopaludibacter sp.]
MASPPIPPIPGHRFSFYPAIRHIEHNEWLFRKATWAELVVVNGKTGLELSIPRRFVGEVSTSDHPVVILGLTRELEFREGAVWPYQRRVIEMPIAVGESVGRTTSRPRSGSLAPVVGIRLESRRDKRIFKWIGGGLAVAILLHVGMNVIHLGEARQRPYLELSRRDDYSSVVRKLGRPAGEYSWSDGAHHFHSLSYHRFTVILMGPTYVGTMDANWKPIQTVELPPTGTSFSLLSHLKRF